MTAPEIAHRRCITADELFRRESGSSRYELIAGSLREKSPAGGRHGRVANRIAWHLSSHLERVHLGVVFAAETGFLIAQAPDTVLAADVAFVSRARFECVGDESRYLPLLEESDLLDAGDVVAGWQVPVSEFFRVY